MSTEMTEDTLLVENENTHNCRFFPVCDADALRSSVYPGIAAFIGTAIFSSVIVDNPWLILMLAIAAAVTIALFTTCLYNKQRELDYDSIMGSEQTRSFIGV